MPKTNSSSGGLTKLGSGTLALGGSNSYGGLTVVNNGNLQLGNGSNAYLGGTQGWVDAQHDLILVLMIQRAKMGNGDASDVRRVFQETAMRAFAE